MALKPLSADQPLGQFDLLDAQTTTPLGGEVCTFTYVALATDNAAADVEDGYAAQANTRAAITTTLVSGDRPLFLLDEGVAGYGTLFGTVVGGAAGKSTSGAVLGPHTATGSGKGTLWHKPGLFAVSLDAVDTTLSSGLVPTNPGLTGGDPLYATTAGKLTPNVAAAFEAVVLGRFIEFAPNGSLVSTPIGSVQTTPARFDNVVFTWNPEI